MLGLLKPKSPYAEHGAEELGGGILLRALHMVVEATASLNQLAIRGEAGSTL